MAVFFVQKKTPDSLKFRGCREGMNVAKIGIIPESCKEPLSIPIHWKSVIFSRYCTKHLGQSPSEY